MQTSKVSSTCEFTLYVGTHVHGHLHTHFLKGNGLAKVRNATKLTL